ncbi:phosphatidylinositol glycan anchor biosynthesis class A [Brevipalpus obovatus]|uniref:phosphatidylinositol glycan anchor biosynthesis class A n=1 Tax=Brevipalpus obovatus TaxID=246614 RepID=UPI003D9E9370
MYRICMVSDFFYPNSGGVESHIFQLSQCLLNFGHKVVVLTHAYGDRKGVRYMSNGLKVYYAPFLVIYNQCTMPTLFCSLPLVRNILIREQIDIVHSHSAFSTMAIESLIHGKMLNLKTVFTDHSLFGFADVSAIITNQLLRMSLIFANAVICVSHVGKENTALRAGVVPEKIFVIPNAVDADTFKPDSDRIKKTNHHHNHITIIVVSRLVYRKGIDLLVEAIPKICDTYEDVKFLIVGDGPKRVNIEQMVETHGLQNRVTLMGMVKHEYIRDILVQGDIFVNSSLTEAFCMAIIEAASCGLQVVSTNVGGIPEVFPDDLIILTEPNRESLTEGISLAIRKFRNKSAPNPIESHKWVREHYRWKNIAQRTLKVYDRVFQDVDEPITSSLNRLWKLGSVCDILMLFVIVIELLSFRLWSYLMPKEKIDKASELASH